MNRTPEPAVTDLELRHPTGVTGIRVGEGAVPALAPWMASRLEGRRLFVVTTEVVLRHHRAALTALEGAGLAPQALTVPDGESAKSLEVAAGLWGELSRGGAKRDSRLLAFGGGSVSDVTGFVAGTFARGIEWLAWPTTLLAQVDAAIGGKTAIDLAEAKNAVGLFHHPTTVVCDTAFLSTLPERELRSGLYEVVKVAALLDAALFERLERDLERLVTGEIAALTPVVVEAARIKARVVEEDPGDRGKRALLNFGHTLGHALEAALGYSRLTHGEAIGHGMRFALRLASRRGLDAGAAQRVERLVGRLAPPVLPDLAPEALVELMARDKKAREAGLAWILPTGLGAGGAATPIAPDELRGELEDFLAGA